jgi:hypothetical protein
MKQRFDALTDLVEKAEIVKKDMPQTPTPAPIVTERKVKNAQGDIIILDDKKDQVSSRVNPDIDTRISKNPLF